MVKCQGIGDESEVDCLHRHNPTYLGMKSAGASKSRGPWLEYLTVDRHAGGDCGDDLQLRPGVWRRAAFSQRKSTAYQGQLLLFLTMARYLQLHVEHAGGIR